MQEINWNCCPLVAQNPITRAFLEQMAKEQKSRSTIENYSRDLNDFLSAFNVVAPRGIQNARHGFSRLPA